jgi:hypothetical protein
VESAVEPTRSLNRTVTWRRSASGAGAGAASPAGACPAATGRVGASAAAGASVAAALSSLRRWPSERPSFQIAVGQFREDVEIDVVFGKNGGQRLQTEISQPIAELRHPIRIRRTVARVKRCPLWLSLSRRIQTSKSMVRRAAQQTDEMGH